MHKNFSDSADSPRERRKGLNSTSHRSRSCTGSSARHVPTRKTTTVVFITTLNPLPSETTCLAKLSTFHLHSCLQTGSNAFFSAPVSRARWMTMSDHVQKDAVTLSVCPSISRVGEQRERTRQQKITAFFGMTLFIVHHVGGHKFLLYKGAFGSRQYT